MKLNDEKNIVLIGMCGVGKSTIGVLLAKAIGRYFLDTDIYIQAIENKGLQQIIDEKGIEAFCRVEQSHVLCVDVKKAVIATGGSVVYSEAAMKHLAKNGIIIHLDLEIVFLIETLPQGLSTQRGQAGWRIQIERPLFPRRGHQLV